MVIPCLSLFACIRGEIVRVPYRRQGAILQQPLAFAAVRVLYRHHEKSPQTECLAASFLVDIPSRWEPRAKQQPTGLIAYSASQSRPVRVLYRHHEKSPQTFWSGDSWWTVQDSNL